jgi:hypothetical protein
MHQQTRHGTKRLLCLAPAGARGGLSLEQEAQARVLPGTEKRVALWSLKTVRIASIAARFRRNFRLTLRSTNNTQDGQQRE